ncbi:MAG TPA: hypothetical protein DCY89_06380 [Gammaproteobacteria bacterium]|nr:hypothetical protein [Gammaproteobacteria bacterium]
MAVLAIAVAGAALGKAIGLTASLGFMVGSMAGNMLFAPRQRGQNIDGPRLGDLRVQSSSYGQMIPIVFGTMRIAGNVIWSTPIKETVIRTRAAGGGKGGRSRGATTTTYRYSVSLAVSLCEGPITGVTTIWANGRVIYNASASATAAELIASNRSAAQIAFYTGSEMQLPDPTMQAHLGAANVPAYRGQAYVVFEDLELEPFGNAIPNLTFEVSTGGAAEVAREVTAPTPPAGFNFLRGFAQDRGAIDKLRMIARTQAFEFTTFELLGGALAPVASFTLPSDQMMTGAQTANADQPFLLSQDAFPPIHISLWDIRGARLFRVPRPVGMGAFIVASIEGDQVFLAGNASAPFQVHAWVRSEYRGATANLGAQILALDTTGTFLYALLHTDPVTVARIRRATLIHEATITPTPAIGGHPRGILRAISDNEFWLGRDGTIRRMDGAGAHATVFTTAPSFGGVGGTGDWSESTISVRSGQALIVRQTTGSATEPRPRVFLLSSVLSHGAAPLGSVVAALCARAGLAAGDTATGALTSMVHGYTIAQQTTVRAALESLQRAYLFDAVESDNVIRFVPRGGSPVATIPGEDLGAREDTQEPPPPLEITRTEEATLPTAVNVVYASRSAAYQQGSQQARRTATQSREVATVELPLALTDDEARQIADRLLYDAWTARTNYRFSTSRRYARLEPTDLVRVEVEGATHTLRIVRKEEGRPGLIRFEGVAELASVYTQTAPGGSGPADTATLALSGPTSLHLLDIPLLRDQDEGAGIYVAAAGFTPHWSGTTIHKSDDAGASYAPVLTLHAAATIGTANTVLPTYAGGNTFDEASTVEVTVQDGELVSVDRANVLADANALLLGDEIVQYRTADLVAPRRYRLSGLLRGRRGTEWAMSTHAVGERAILLDADLRRLVAASAEIGLQRLFRAPAFSETVQETLAIAFTNTGQGLSPYAPAHLGAGRNAAGDVIIRWTRRTRIDGAWRDHVDAALGEVDESYDVEIWDPAFTTLRRTLTTSTPTATYTQAQATTDGGALVSYGVRVFQRSATVGRGRPLQGVISG